MVFFNVMWSKSGNSIKSFCDVTLENPINAVKTTLSQIIIMVDFFKSWLAEAIVNTYLG